MILNIHFWKIILGHFGFKKNKMKIFLTDLIFNPPKVLINKILKIPTILKKHTQLEIQEIYHFSY